DDRHDALGDRSARSRDRARRRDHRPRQEAAPGRAAVPLGLDGADDRRVGERPRADRARPERPHPRGEGLHVRHPSRPPPAGRGAPGARRVAEAPGARGARAGAAAGARAEEEDVTDLAEPTARPAAWPDSYGAEAQPRLGFFTDTSVCIGCKACEVACKEWNLVPEDGLVWTGESYDNTSALGAN